MFIVSMPFQPAFLLRVTLEGMTERLKYKAFIFLLTTTFGEFTFSKASNPSSGVKGFTKVAICVAESSKQAFTASSCDL